MGFWIRIKYVHISGGFRPRLGLFFCSKNHLRALLQCRFSQKFTVCKNLHKNPVGGLVIKSWDARNSLSLLFPFCVFECVQFFAFSGGKENGKFVLFAKRGRPASFAISSATTTHPSSILAFNRTHHFWILDSSRLATPFFPNSESFSARAIIKFFQKCGGGQHHHHRRLLLCTATAG